MKISFSVKQNVYEIFFSPRNENLRVDELKVRKFAIESITRNEGNIAKLTEELHAQKDLNIFVYEVKYD